MSADILRILVVLVGIVVVAVVLIQQPKEGGMGVFSGGGGGASGTVFGAKGSGSFLFRLTAGATIVFAVLIIALVKVTNTNLGGDVLSKPAVEAGTIPGTATTATDAIPGEKPVNSTGQIPGQVEKPAE